MLYKISRDFYFCYGHRLAKHGGKCRNLHGHNAKVTVTVEASYLSEDGMVIDFFDLKKIGDWIDSTIDHKMLLWEGDPLLSILEPYVLVVGFHPTAENIAQWILNVASDMGFKVSSIKFWETEKCFVEVSN